MINSYIYPGTLGDIKDPSEAISKIHKKNGKAILACDLLALAKLKTPRELGADIAVGSSQRFGIPMGYGGPHAAFFATKDDYKRSMPGRIVGVSVDRHGNKAYRLSLQTREQHTYIFRANKNQNLIQHACKKKFHVSPFIKMDCNYFFRVLNPAQKLQVIIDQYQ